MDLSQGKWRWLQHLQSSCSDYSPSFRAALIDVACVYPFATPLNLWIQCYTSTKGMTLGAGREGARSCAVLIYTMLCRAIERQHRWRVWDETARGLWFCIGVRRPLGWISYISHTGSCPLCHKNNKHAATRNERSASGTKGKTECTLVTTVWSQLHIGIGIHLSLCSRIYGKE